MEGEGRKNVSESEWRKIKRDEEGKERVWKEETFLAYGQQRWRKSNRE